MSAPLKPWEKPGVNSMRSSMSSSHVDQMSSNPFTLQSGLGASPAPAAPRNPPPVPARNTLPQRPFSSGYGGYGYSNSYGTSYGGIGGYGGYGGYGTGYSPMSMYGGGMYGGGYGMNRFGNEDYTPNGFVQQAELSSRQAFQSIESIVHAVGSVAVMLESTFQAVYNSFRAVIGVADHMSRLRTHMTRIFSALAILRTLRWLVSRLLILLRLRRPTPLEEEAWSKAGQEVLANVAAEASSIGVNRANWPIMLFFAIIVGGPWLIWKFLSLLAGNVEKNDWSSGADDHFLAVAEFDFTGQNPDELSFRQGAHLIVAPKELQPQTRGWLLACVNGQSEKTGLIPANYIRMLGKRRGTRHAPQPGAAPTVEIPQVPASMPARDFVQTDGINESGAISSFDELFTS